MSARESIECTDHGTGLATYMCRHLITGIGCGYHASKECDDEWPDAWCDQCDAAWSEAGEWTDALAEQLDIGLVCSGCYGEARDRNTVVPAPFTAGKLSLSDEECEQMIAAACERAKTLNERAEHDFQIGGHGRWAADYDASIFKFTTEEGAVRVVADMQIVGSFSKKSSSWLWSWANEINNEANVRLVARLQALGHVRGMKLLAERFHEDVDEVHGWHLTSLACQILDFDVCYRAPMDHRYLYLILRNLRWVS